MSQLFNTPGDTLEGLALSHFEDIRKAVERGTTDMLIRPDWEANLQVCDLVNQTLDFNIITEVIFLLRRRLGSISTPLNPVSAKQVFLTLSLAEALVKNCGQRLHTAVNDECFMEEMKNVARRYNGRSGSDNVQVAETALDIIQAWGEGFLTKRRQFPNIVAAYHELKKEGLRFKPQYDASRVPIFTPAGEGAAVSEGGETHINDNSDMILAAAIQAEESRGGRTVQPDRMGEIYHHQPSSSGTELPRVADAVHTSVTILVAMMKEAGAPRVVADDDVALELKQQIVAQQQHLAREIETRIMNGEESEQLALMFKLNDEAQTLVDAYDGCRNGTFTQQELNQALSKVQVEPDTGSGLEQQTEQLSLNRPENSDNGGLGNLLDLSPNSPVRDTTHASRGQDQEAWGDLGKAPGMAAIDAKEQIKAQQEASKGTGDLFDLLSTPMEDLSMSTATAQAGTSSSGGSVVKPLRRLSAVGQIVNNIEEREKQVQQQAAAASWLSKAGSGGTSNPASPSKQDWVPGGAKLPSNPLGTAPVASTTNTASTFDLLGGFDESAPAAPAPSTIPILKPPPRLAPPRDTTVQAELKEIDLMAAVQAPSVGKEKKKEEVANPFDLF